MPVVLFGNACVDVLAGQMALLGRTPQVPRELALANRAVHLRVLEHLVVANRVNLELRSAAGIVRAKRPKGEPRVVRGPGERGHLLSHLPPWWQCSRCAVWRMSDDKKVWAFQCGGGSTSGCSSPADGIAPATLFSVLAPGGGMPRHSE